MTDRLVITLDDREPDPLPPPPPPPAPYGYGAPPAPFAPGAYPYPYPARTTGWTGPVFAMLGGAVVVAGSLVEWIRGSYAGSGKVLNTFQLSFSMLFNYRYTGDPPKFGALVVALGVLGAGLAAIPNVSWPRRLCGVAALAVVAAYVIQNARALADYDTGKNLFDVLGAGVYITAVGAIVMIAVPGRRAIRMPGYPMAGPPG